VGAVAVYADGGDGADNSSNNPSASVDVKADYETGYRLLKDGDYKSAIKSFKQVIDEEPEHAMAYTNMAYAYRKLGRYEKAVRLYCMKKPWRLIRI
jgi:pentatricopeptide repeat protein